jgi:hypothetical protein
MAQTPVPGKQTRVVVASPVAREEFQNARIVWTIGTHPSMPAV